MFQFRFYIAIKLFLLLNLISFSVHSAVFKVGEPEVRHGMSIQALYIQAVKVTDENESEIDQLSEEMKQMKNHDHTSMSSVGQRHPSEHNMEGDIHLEASVKATSENDWGFPEGAWIPYLRIYYSVTKSSNNNWESRGTLIPMAANDGPHYGNNVKLDGPGKYMVRMYVMPPDGSVFMRHFDRETGVDAWWKAYEIKRHFTFIGVGKKGAY